MSKKFLAKLLIFCLVFTMLPASAFAGVDIHPGGDGITTYSITMDTDAKVTVGKTVALNYQLWYNDDYGTAYDITQDTDLIVEWHSDDETIATVKDGVVTGVKEGEVQIRAYFEADVADCWVTVAPAPAVPVTGVTLNKTELTLNSGATETLAATVAPENASEPEVTWASSDSAVVTVDAKGQLTAKHSGTATVTATAGDFTAKCVVTVNQVLAKVEVACPDSAVAEKIQAAVQGNKVLVSGALANSFTGVVYLHIYGTDDLNKVLASPELTLVEGEAVLSAAEFTVGATKYSLELQNLVIEQAPVVAAKPRTEIKVPENAAPEVKAAAEAAAQALQTSFDKIEANGVVGVVSAVKSEGKDGSVTVGNLTVTKKQLEDEAEILDGPIGVYDAYVQPTIALTVIGAEVAEDGAITALKFDITLLAEVWVHKDNGSEHLVNASRVAYTEIPTNEEIYLQLPVPAEFLAAADQVFVNHHKSAAQTYYYGAVMDKTANTVAFTTKHGFSEFEITTEANFAAAIGDEYFATLQAAVDAVKDGQVIVIAKGGEHKATVSKEVEFAVVNPVEGATVAITAGSGYTLAEKDGNYTVTYNGGGYGGGSASGNVSIATKVTGGKVTVSPTRPTRGQTATINVTPNEGYKLDSLTVTDNKGNAVELTKVSDTKYTFVMPAGKVTVTPAFVKLDAVEETKEPAAVKRFSDVASGAWYAEYITYVTENALMNGYDDGRFGPNDQTTRAQIVTVLYRLEGEPATRSSNSFSDVSAGGQYYSSAVAWAAINNIVNGYEDGRFGPNDNVTREQIAAILYRYASYKGYDVENTTGIDSFSDAAKVSSWAQTAISWAVGDGLMNGDNGALRPQGNATRAEIAALLMRFAENIAR